MQGPYQDNVDVTLEMLNRKLNDTTSTREELTQNNQPKEIDPYQQDWEQQVKEAKAKNTIHAHEHEKQCRKIQVYTIPVVFAIVLFWLLCTQVIVILVGSSELDLSDTIMVAYLTSTTVNVIGLLYVILKWLYHTPLQEGSKSS